MKKLLFSLLSMVVLAITLPLLACGAPKNKKFDSFPEYKNFAEGVVAIDVRWDCEGVSVYFTIDDSEQVENIVNLFSETIFKRYSKESNTSSTGQPHSIRFVYENQPKVGVNLNYMTYKGYIYAYPNKEIYNYIEQIGKDKGVISYKWQ